MIIFLAVILGNTSAWLVHSGTWWLRLHGLKWISFFGFLCGALPVFLSLMGLHVGGTIYGWVTWRPLWLVILGVGWLQSRWIKEETAPVFFAVCALFAEVLLAQILYIGMMTLVAPKILVWRSQNVFFWTFWTTLLLLAVFRPLVVRYSQRFRTLIRHEHIEPTT